MQIEKLKAIANKMEAVENIYENTVWECTIDTMDDTDKAFEHIKNVHMVDYIAKEHYLSRNPFQKAKYEQCFGVLFDATALAVEVLTHIKNKRLTPYAWLENDGSIEETELENMQKQRALLINAQQKNVKYTLDEAMTTLKSALLDGIIEEIYYISVKDKEMANAYRNHRNMIKVAMKTLCGMDPSHFMPIED